MSRFYYIIHVVITLYVWSSLCKTAAYCRLFQSCTYSLGKDNFFTAICFIHVMFFCPTYINFIQSGLGTPIRRGLGGISILKWSPTGDYFFAAKL